MSLSPGEFYSRTGLYSEVVDVPSSDGSHCPEISQLKANAALNLSYHVSEGVSEYPG